jgi:hypothetical protein
MCLEGWRKSTKRQNHDIGCPKFTSDTFQVQAIRVSVRAELVFSDGREWESYYGMANKQSGSSFSLIRQDKTGIQRRMLRVI